jgi:hypothetical protein
MKHRAAFVVLGSAVVGLGGCILLVEALTGATIPVFHPWQWLWVAPFALVVAGICIVVAAVGWSHRHIPVTDARRGGSPMLAPTEYQVRALRQVVAKIAETSDSFDNQVLNAALLNLPRKHMDPIYEPLYPTSCRAGLNELVKRGELIEFRYFQFQIVNRVTRRPLDSLQSRP